MTTQCVTAQVEESPYGLQRLPHLGSSLLQVLIPNEVQSMWKEEAWQTDAGRSAQTSQTPARGAQSFFSTHRLMVIAISSTSPWRRDALVTFSPMSFLEGLVLDPVSARRTFEWRGQPARFRP
jgi:hypothetical protein